MKNTTILPALFVSALALCMLGCPAIPPTPSPKPAQSGTPAPSGTPRGHHLGGLIIPPYPSHYQDTTRGFSLNLPHEVNKSEAAGQLKFDGFAVPKGTNLRSKSLVVASSNDVLAAATPAGSLAVSGIVLKRAEFDEGSAGHSTLHVIYTWKNGAKSLYFDFMHYSVNRLNYGPENRPNEYDRAAQIKITEEIMRTFRPL